VPNPNNCPECDHHKTQRAIEASKPEEQKLHCYMFKDEPHDVCMQHTMRDPVKVFRRLMGDFLQGKI
jgi:hypothetical protein